MMRRALLCVSLLASTACSSVVSLQSAVAKGSETFEPRLVGTWSLTGGSDTDRVVITREASTLYLLRYTSAKQNESAVLSARFGPLGPRRWVLDLAPVGDTTHYYHPLPGGDSTRTRPPDVPLMMPVHMQLVVERADSGLRLYAIDADSLIAYVTRRPAATPFGVHPEDLGNTIVLTDSSAARLNAFLATFADQPGVLKPLPRVGSRVTIPF